MCSVLWCAAAQRWVDGWVQCNAAHCVSCVWFMVGFAVFAQASHAQAAQVLEAALEETPFNVKLLELATTAARALGRVRGGGVGGSRLTWCGAVRCGLAGVRSCDRT